MPPRRIRLCLAPSNTLVRMDNEGALCGNQWWRIGLQQGCDSGVTTQLAAQRQTSYLGLSKQLNDFVSDRTNLDRANLAGHDEVFDGDDGHSAFGGNVFGLCIR